MALACEPAVVVLDEPTTGLDVLTQARILAELVRLRDERQISMVYVTHDLAVVAKVADRIAVMYAGRIVEQGRTDRVLRRPRHPYTRGLLASIPDHLTAQALEPMPGTAVGVGDRPVGCAFAPRCPQRHDDCSDATPSLRPLDAEHQVRCLHPDQTPEVSVRARPVVPRNQPTVAPVLRIDGLEVGHRSRREVITVARDVSFEIQRGECVALVGESGSGKTTIARAVAGLHPVSLGTLQLNGSPLPSPVGRRTIDQRRSIQIVFQNPADALNPSHTVADTIARPARVLGGLGVRDARLEVAPLLELVRLPARVAERYPYELSGGERQRVAIARALAAKPELILCDEITSALDVSVQAAVLTVLQELRDQLGLSLLFITHDLGVVATVADWVLVLDQGRICERGRATEVLRAPSDPYTRRLLDAAPSISSAIKGWTGASSAAAELTAPVAVDNESSEPVQ
jgi:peptide/nickel transport system ATP-binding protein